MKWRGRRDSKVSQLFVREMHCGANAGLPPTRFAQDEELVTVGAAAGELVLTQSRHTSTPT
jgi:hypothetical protein